MAFMELNEASHPQSVYRRSCVEFISELLLARTTEFPVEFVKSCLLSLPKLLFKIQANSPATSETILNTFLEIAKRKPDLFNETQQTLVPFFFTAIKPNPKYPEGGRFFGPFVDLPPHLQFLSISLIYYYKNLEISLEKALLACCLRQKKGPENGDIHDIMELRVFSHVLDMFYHHHMTKNMPLDRYLGLLITLLTGLISMKPTLSPELNSEWESKIDSMAERVCWNVSAICGKYRGIDIYKALSSVVEKSLVEHRESMLATKCLVRLIEACFNDRTAWSEGPVQPPENLKIILSDVLVNCLLAFVATHDATSPDLSGFAWVMSNFEIIPSVLNIFKGKVGNLDHSSDLLWHSISCVHSIVITRSLESSLRQQNCKMALLELAEIFKEKDDMSSEISQKTLVLKKLFSEIELLYGASNSTPE